MEETQPPPSKRSKVTAVKRILGLTIVLALVASMVAGGVLAYFIDVENSSDNVLSAGTLNLSPSTDGDGPASKYTVTAGGDGANGNVVFQNLLPGESGNVTWTLTNAGTLDGTLVISSSVAFSENASNEIETAVPGNNGGGDGDLDAYLGVKLQRGIGYDQASATANFTYLLGSSGSYAAASGLQAALNSGGAAMAASGSNDTIVYRLSWEIGSLFGGTNQNIVQSDTAQIDITFALNQ